MIDIKYVIRMEAIDVRIDRPSYDTTSFEVYDTLGEAVKEYNQQIKYMQEDYVDGPRPDQESIAIMSLYAVEVTEDCHPDPKKYALIDLIHQTIAQFGSVKTFWATRQCEDNDDWEDCK
jgi:hypothetical protein